MSERISSAEKGDITLGALALRLSGLRAGDVGLLEKAGVTCEVLLADRNAEHYAIKMTFPFECKRIVDIAPDSGYEGDDITEDLAEERKEIGQDTLVLTHEHYVQNVTVSTQGDIAIRVMRRNENGSVIMTGYFFQ